jgi:hypothetical protein
MIMIMKLVSASNTVILNGRKEKYFYFEMVIQTAKVYYCSITFFSVRTCGLNERGAYHQPQTGSMVLLQIQTGYFGEPTTPSASDPTLALDQYQTSPKRCGRFEFNATFSSGFGYGLMVVPSELRVGVQARGRAELRLTQKVLDRVIPVISMSYDIMFHNKFI